MLKSSNQMWMPTISGAFLRVSNLIFVIAKQKSFHSEENFAQTKGASEKTCKFDLKQNEVLTRLKIVVCLFIVLFRYMNLENLALFL